MSKNAGERMVGPCPYCGQRYMRTNWMKRSNGERDSAGRLLSDTHLIACHRRHIEESAVEGRLVNQELQAQALTRVLSTKEVVDQDVKARVHPSCVENAERPQRDNPETVLAPPAGREQGPGDAAARREAGGRIVREAWIRWARTHPDPKPSWLVPYDELSEHDREADRQIYEACVASCEPLPRDIADASRVLSWARDPARKSPGLAFTAGPERQAAYWIEWAWANVELGRA